MESFSALIKVCVYRLDGSEYRFQFSTSIRDLHRAVIRECARHEIPQIDFTCNVRHKDGSMTFIVSERL